MNWTATIIAFACAAGAAHAAECDINGISAALDASLEGLKPVEVEPLERLSTEGGLWFIYRDSDGRLRAIIRGDYGESGKNETRLGIASRTAWGIASTRFDNNRHAFAEDGGPLAIVKQTTDFYYFCDGALYTPLPDWSTTGEDYVKAAGEAKDSFFKAKEIAEFVKGLAR